MGHLIDQVYEEYKDQLTKKVSIKNKRTKEDLLAAITNEYDAFVGDESQEYILEKLRRAAFTYMNEPLVYKLVRKFDNLPLPEEDRLSAARIGFVIALNKFNPDLGYKFSTFAWRVISNEIIHANKLYLRPGVYYENDRTVYSIHDGTVKDVIKSDNARKVIRQGERVIPYDIVVQEGASEYTYPYVYDLEVEIGSPVKPGMVLGQTAGVIYDVNSTDKIKDDENIGDVIFEHLFEKEDDGITDEIINEQAYDIILNGLEDLTDLERDVIINRFLVDPKVPRSKLSERLGISEYLIVKEEESALEKLRQLLANENIEQLDLDL